MKTLILICLVSCLSSSAFAAVECQKEAIEIAKVNLDSKAKAYGFRTSDLDEESLELIEKTNESSAFTIVGFIYKATYEIQLKLDTLCSLEQLKITEIGAH